MQVYLVSKEKCVVGVFTNRAWMMNEIGHLFTHCYIKGARKNLAVTANSIGIHMTNGYLPIYNTADEIEVRIWKLNVNTINPQFK